MIYSERMNRNAVFVSSDQQVEHLRRIPFMHGTFNEKWLQELIASHPSLLQSEEIGAEYANLVCIGTEVKVGAGETTGYIDNLYVSASGQVVIVETKLFRNQEARRTVIAQIIDYAKEVQQWDAEKLDEIAADYTYLRDGQASRVFDLMLKEGYLTAGDSSRFVDSINRNLEQANFLLLVVGDGIRSGVQQLAEFLQNYASMSFKLALMEMEVYEHANGVVVIPNILTKTAVIRRTIYTGHQVQENELSEKQGQVPQSPVPTQQEFINIFSANGGYDSSQVTSFISDVSSVPGVSLTLHPSAIRIRVTLSDGSACPVLIFGKSGSFGNPAADIWVRPEDITSKLVKAGHDISEADEYLDFYRKFIDKERCKHEPYTVPAGFYYAYVRKVLQNSEAFMEALEQLISVVSE